jgi:hypothetical protein
MEPERVIDKALILGKANTISPRDNHKTASLSGESSPSKQLDPANKHDA